MGAQNDGGPFHPVVHCGVNNGTGYTTGYQTEANWTVRDEFAAKAMQAMITKSSGQDSTGGKSGVPLISKYAYEYADAMLAERAKGEQP